MENWSISLPDRQDIKVVTLMGKGLTVLGCVILVLAGMVLVTDGIAAALPVVILAVPLLLLGIYISKSCAASVHLVPQGIAVTRGDRLLRQYPREELGLFFRIKWFDGKHMADYLGISTHSMEGLAQLREDQLKKGVFTKEELPFRKQKENWQHTFAMEYLMRRAQWSAVSCWKNDIIWLELNPQVLALLRHLYPEVACDQFIRQDYKGLTSPWTDPDPHEFARSRSGNIKADRAGSYGLLVLAAIPLAVELYLMVAHGGGLDLLFIGILFAACMGRIVYAFRGETDLFRISPLGMDVRRGNRQAVHIPAEQIRLIVKSEPRGLTTVAVSREKMLFVSKLAAEELARRELEAKAGSYAQACRQVSRWQEYAVFNYLSRSWNEMAEPSSDVQRMVWNAQREESLRAMFPDAQFWDLTADALYEDLFEEKGN